VDYADGVYEVVRSFTPAGEPNEATTVLSASRQKRREGKSNQLSRFPYILGRDFSGVVSAVGEGVRDLGVGDEVFGVCDVGQEGAYAEKIAIKAAIVARKTDRLSHLPPRWRLPG
jgi:hypothetical protein